MKNALDASFYLEKINEYSRITIRGRCGENKARRRSKEWHAKDKPVETKNILLKKLPKSERVDKRGIEALSRGLCTA